MGKLGQPCPSRSELHIAAVSHHANMGKTRGHGTRKGGASSGRARGGGGWRPANDAAASDESGSESEEERVTKVKVKRDGESRLAGEQPSAALFLHVNSAASRSPRNLPATQLRSHDTSRRFVCFRMTRATDAHVCTVRGQGCTVTRGWQSKPPKRHCERTVPPTCMREEESKAQ